MRFLLDTNVISELRKGDRANPGVVQWIESTTSEDLALSVLVIGELQLGVLRLEKRDPDAAADLATWLSRLRRTYQRRILSVNTDVVETWARINVDRPLPVIDSLLAATAQVHGLTLVTRNVADLEGVAVSIENPFV